MTNPGCTGNNIRRRRADRNRVYDSPRSSGKYAHEMRRFVCVFGIANFSTRNPVRVCSRTENVVEEHKGPCRTVLARLVGLDVEVADAGELVDVPGEHTRVHALDSGRRYQ